MKNLPLMYLDAKPPKLHDQSVPNARFRIGLIACLLHFIEYYTAGLVYPEETDDRCNKGKDSKKLEIGRREHEDIVVRNAVGAVVRGLFHFRGCDRAVGTSFLIRLRRSFRSHNRTARINLSRVSMRLLQAHVNR